MTNQTNRPRSNEQRQAARAARLARAAARQGDVPFVSRRLWAALNDAANAAGEGAAAARSLLWEAESTADLREAAAAFRRSAS